MRHLSTLLLFLAFWALHATPARAQVLVSTFGPGLSFSSTSTYGLNANAEFATRFVVTANSTLSRVDLGLQKNTPDPTITITARIVQDSLNVPTGPQVWSASNTAVGARGIYSFTAPPPASTATLQVGQAYWLIVSSGQASAFWWESQPAVAGTVANKNSAAAPYVTSTNQTLPAYQLVQELGACCSQRTGVCSQMAFADCSRLGLLAFSPGSACAPTPCPPPTTACPADFNGSGTLTVADIFAFLSAWFAGCP